MKIYILAYYDQEQTYIQGIYSRKEYAEEHKRIIINYSRKDLVIDEYELREGLPLTFTLICQKYAKGSLAHSWVENVIDVKEPETTIQFGPAKLKMFIVKGIDVTSIGQVININFDQWHKIWRDYDHPNPCLWSRLQIPRRCVKGME